MKNLIIGVVSVLVVIGLVITSVLYHDLYEKEKEKMAAAHEKIEKLEYQVQANKMNQPEDLTKTANKFIKTLFFKGEKDVESQKKSILSFTTGKAYNELNKDNQEAHMDDLSELEGFTSEAVIKDSFYNRTSNAEARVRVTFEQLLTTNGITAKTLNEAVVKLKFVNDQWKVYEFEITPLI